MMPLTPRSIVRLLLAVVCGGLLSLPAAAQVGQPAPADKYVQVNGLRLHYLDWGNAERPTLIMLHGIARLAHTFDHIAPKFTGEYHVIAIDMRGHGDSDWDPAAAYLVEDYVKDLEAFVSQ